MEELDHDAGQALQEKEEDSEKKSQSQLILELTSDMELVHNEMMESYARIFINNHYEVWNIRSRQMSFILKDRYMENYKGKVPNENSMKEAVSALEAKAVLRGEQVSIHTRTAETKEAIYIDLCNDKWEAIEIKKSGWSIISEPPVYFKRSNIMKELPTPKTNGRIDELKKLINYKNDNDYKLIIAWLLSTVKENSPFPLLNIQGEQGSAKSSASKMLRELIDPSSLPLRGLPKDEQTLAISANNTWVLAYDNLSGLSANMSDSLCKLSTGGGLSVRELYTTGEEAVFSIMRPAILNGIDDIAQRPDLLDRSLVINLPRMDEESRTDEKTLWEDFYNKQSDILGGLCDVIAGGLNELESTTLAKQPRMADFALWVTACEKALGWYEGEFMDIYNINRNEAIDQGIESDSFATAIIQLLEDVPEWEGNASQLVAEAGRYADERTRNSKAFPTSRSVRNRIKRINPSLREKNIFYEPEYNKMKKTLKLSSLSSYRHDLNSGKGSTDYDNNYDKSQYDDDSHLSSFNYDDEKLSSLDKPRHINNDYDDYDNYDNIVRINKEDIVL